MGIAKLAFESQNEMLRLKISGNWLISSGIYSQRNFAKTVTTNAQIREVVIIVEEDTQWDSGLIAFLLKFVRECEVKKIHVERRNLPSNIQKMLDLALRVQERNIVRETKNLTTIEQIGELAYNSSRSFKMWLDFLGEIAIAFKRFVTGKAYFRGQEFCGIMQRCGVESLPLVSLISILVGVILAFVAVIQLRMFGAEIFVADIVGISMVRVLSAIMTGILMAGRIGAAFAAELGLMESNEEIDALKTIGVSPVEFLVLPRVLAMLLMMPVLTVYADLMGVIGGLVGSVGMMHINPMEYLEHTQNAVKMSYVWIGLVHSVVFAVIIAVSGCLRGMNCDRSATGVGSAATSAVVTAITGIVIATAIITFICQVIGI